MAKANLFKALDHSRTATMEAEAEAQREAAATYDAEEGITAFLTKRDPVFKGK